MTVLSSCETTTPDLKEDDNKIDVAKLERPTVEPKFNAIYDRVTSAGGWPETGTVEDVEKIITDIFELNASYSMNIVLEESPKSGSDVEVDILSA